MSTTAASRFSVLNDETFTNPSKKNKKKKPEAVVKPTPKKVENANAVKKPIANQAKNGPKNNQAKPQQNVAPNNADGEGKKKKKNKANAGTGNAPAPKQPAQQPNKNKNANKKGSEQPAQAKAQPQKKAAPVKSESGNVQKNAENAKVKPVSGKQANDGVANQVKKLREEVAELRSRNVTLLSLLQNGEMKDKQELLKQNQSLMNELAKLKSMTPAQKLVASPKQKPKQPLQQQQQQKQKQKKNANVTTPAKKSSGQAKENKQPKTAPKKKPNVVNKAANKTVPNKAANKPANKPAKK